MPAQTAGLVDSGLSIAGSMGGLGAIRTSQLATFPKFRLPNEILTGRCKSFNSTPLKLNNISSRNRLVPNLKAKGPHSVFRRNSLSGKVTHYETFRPHTNPFDPKPWESIKRLDNSGRGDISHFNKVLKVEVFEPHVHDPHALGGVRPADYWEIPK